uniref:Uncharacterized protein n=1 Tax=Ditylenchus dipsaci TaxID=166011 RepID=A0A915CQ39_9BILA
MPTLQFPNRKNIRLSPQDEFLVEPVDPASTTTDILLKTVELECRNNECTCPAGFKGEPSVDSKGDLLICKNSQDCGKGSMCEPADKIAAREPIDVPRYVETGELCGRQEVRNSHPAFTAQVHNSARQPRHQQEQECAKETDICIIPKHTKEKICCTEEDI